MKFRLSGDFEIDSEKEPYDREGLRLSIFGGSGSGKSWLAAKFIEDFLSQGGTVVIFQPTDEYYTLKEKFSIFCIGGVHAKDVDFTPRVPSLYAKAVVEQGVNLVFYTSEVTDEDKLIDFVSSFLNQVMRLEEVHHRPILLVIEECQKYAPLRASGHVAPNWVYSRMILAFQDVFERGRKLNISGIAISPRPQAVNMGIRQLANITFYGKFAPRDIAYIDKELQIYRDKGIDVDSSRLNSLGKGEWLSITQDASFIHVTAKRVTRHGAETPKLEYVAPVTDETKQAVSSLLESVREALEKEGEAESELQKASSKVKSLEKQLDEALDKIRTFGNLREMLLKGDGDPEKIKEAYNQGFNEGARKGETANKEEVDKLLNENSKLTSELETLENQLASERGFSSLFTSMTDKSVEAHLKDIRNDIDILKQRHGSQQSTADTKIELTQTKTMLNLKVAKNTLTASTDTPEGMLIYMVTKEGLLKKPKVAGEVTVELRLRGRTISDRHTYNVLDKLVEAGLLLKKSEGKSIFYSQNPDWEKWVEVKEAT